MAPTQAPEHSIDRELRAREYVDRDDEREEFEQVYVYESDESDPADGPFDIADIERLLERDQLINNLRCAVDQNEYNRLYQELPPDIRAYYDNLLISRERLNPSPQNASDPDD